MEKAQWDKANSLAVNFYVVLFVVSYVASVAIANHDVVSVVVHSFAILVVTLVVVIGVAATFAA